jgi:uncharacterized membrane protein YfcA
MDYLYPLFAITFAAYFVKGLTGFGPALIIIPFFTLLLGAEFALPALALFDLVAGIILFVSVYKKINWQFCLPLLIFIGLGSFVGANMVLAIPLPLITYLIGIIIFCFAIYLLFVENSYGESEQSDNPTFRIKRTAGASLMAFSGGVLGGLAGISGPPLIIYLKKYFSKSFFRTQLIVIFLFENMVKLLVYYKGGWVQLPQLKIVFLNIPVLLLGLGLGSVLHFRISDRLFNRVVAVILILISLKIILN